MVNDFATKWLTVYDRVLAEWQFVAWLFVRAAEVSAPNPVVRKFIAYVIYSVFSGDLDHVAFRLLNKAGENKVSRVWE